MAFIGAKPVKMAVERGVMLHAYRRWWMLCADGWTPIWVARMSLTHLVLRHMKGLRINSGSITEACRNKYILYRRLIGFRYEYLLTKLTELRILPHRAWAVIGIYQRKWLHNQPICDVARLASKCHRRLKKHYSQSGFQIIIDLYRLFIITLRSSIERRFIWHMT